MDRRIRLWMMICFCQVMVIAAMTDSNDLSVLNTLKSRWQNLPPDWKGSDPCGSNWEGIKCTDSRVTTLVMASMGVKTTDIREIPSLSMLQHLDLSYNRGIKAVLPPSIQNLKNLTTLILIGCSFMGQIPDSMGSLKQLVYLDLNNNRFTGPIPPSIGNLTNLSWLDLSDNQLSGPIPVSNSTAPGLDNLVITKHFHLSNNQLSGPIISQLFNSNMSLIHFTVNNNQLSGLIPASIGTVQTLEVMLTGDVPQELTELKRVSELYLSNNNLTGPIPDLSGMNSLSYVDMSSNSFEYSDIPAWFTLPSLTTILMGMTQLQGEIPSDVFQAQLERLVLSSNRLNGTLDVGNSYSSDLIVDLSDNFITNFTQSSGYNFSLNLDNNPICEVGATARYCAGGKPDPRKGLPTNSCPLAHCGSHKVLSPKCKCTKP